MAVKSIIRAKGGTDEREVRISDIVIRDRRRQHRIRCLQTRFIHNWPDVKHLGKP
jgi:hypothetical protein